MFIQIVNVNLILWLVFAHNLPELIVLLIHRLDVSLNCPNFLLEFIDLVVKDFVVCMDCHFTINKTVDSFLDLLKVLVVQVIQFTSNRSNYTIWTLRLHHIVIWRHLHSVLLDLRLLSLLLLLGPWLRAWWTEALRRGLLNLLDCLTNYINELILHIPLLVITSHNHSILFVYVGEMLNLLRLKLSVDIDVWRAVGEVLG